MDYFKQTKKIIDQNLKDIFKEELKIYKSNQILSDNIQDFVRLSKGGKRIRAIMVRIGSELTGKKVNYLPIATAVELLQTSILIHDDIIDNAKTRRGEITINHKYQDLGVAKAICVGDYGLFLAYKTINNSKMNNKHKQKVMEITTKMMSTTIMGEMLDVELPTKSPTYEDLNLIYEQKTAWYTIIGPLLMGASLNKLSKKLEQQIIDFGLNLGIAFQIKDDILSITSDETNKCSNSDIIEGKVTEMYLYTVGKTPDKLKYYGKKDITNAQIKVIKNAFKKNGSIQLAEEKALNYSNKSLEILETMKINKNTKEHLKTVVKILITRNN